MFSLNEFHHYYLCTGSFDMRKGFDALCGVVRSDMGRNPLSDEASRQCHQVKEKRDKKSLKLLKRYYFGTGNRVRMVFFSR
jgi:hypothetical protein